MRKNRTSKRAWISTDFDGYNVWDSVLSFFQIFKVINYHLILHIYLEVIRSVPDNWSTPLATSNELLLSSVMNPFSPSILP